MTNCMKLNWRTMNFLSPLKSLLLVFWILIGLALSEPPLIIAHRGASGIAPENTMEAFNLAWKLGADGIEGDFHLTHDGHIIAIHDANTSKVSGGSVNLRVKEVKLKELQGIDVGSWKDEKFSSARIPTLEQIIDSLPIGKKFFIEIKCGTEIVDPLVKVLDQRIDKRPELANQISFISFDYQVIKACRNKWPNIEANFLESYKKNKETGNWSPDKTELLKTLKKSSASGIGTQANKEVIDSNFVKSLRKSRLTFHCWTINDIETARHFRDLGVDSITTDFPKRIRDGLK
ncbi:MAG: glycerophosphodiester phosphodiesterase [Verrucomicrobiaceae bacterium]|nr:glycerophosphodiester phosphodiesterase [Verrucomicrobiaceae bacterium]